jgi:hypothetical protein
MEFTDCLKCGKRVATTARVCHHCKTERNTSASKQSKVVSKRPAEDDSEFDEDYEEGSHAALGYGGYDNHDMDDATNGAYPKSRKIWVAVAWLLIFIFAGAVLAPFWMRR